MKLHLPLRLIRALTVAVIASSSALGAQPPVNIYNIGQLYSRYHMFGDLNFIFQANIVLDAYEATRENGGGYNPESDDAIPYLSNWYSGRQDIPNRDKTVTIDGNGYWIGEANHVHNHSGYISRSFSIDAGTYMFIKNLNFLNNYGAASFQMKAGAIYNVGREVTFEQCNFTSNHLKGEGSRLSYGQGGAMYIGDSLSTKKTEAIFIDCRFEGNFIDIKSTGPSASSCSGEGGALLLNSYSSVTIGSSKIGSVFDENRVSVESSNSTSYANGGAIFNSGNMTINDVSFTRNLAENKSSSNVSNNVQANGGAIYFYSGIGGEQMLTLNNCSFENNAVKGLGSNKGGAIYLLTSTASQGFLPNVFTDCSFIGNTASSGIQSKGGAVYMEGTGDVSFVALNKDVVFRGNFVNADNAATKRANAICFETGYSSSTARIINVDFSAKNSYVSDDPTRIGTSIIFYDSVDFKPNTLYGSKVESLTQFNFNRSSGQVDYLGRIVFTGIDYQGDDAQSVASRTSTGNEYTLFAQWNGLVQITEKAIVGVKEARKYDEGGYEIGAKSYSQNGGTLEISKEGHLLVSSFEVKKGTVSMKTNGRMTVDSFATNGDVWKDTTLDLSDNTAKLTANTIDLSKGARLELGISPSVPGVDTPCGWQVTANSITLGGTLGIADSPLDYYMNSQFKESQQFLVFKGLNDSMSYVDADGTPVISESYNSSEVSDYYTGSWSYKIVENADGTKDFYAVWTVKGGGGHVKPELSGDNVENSIWSTDSNMKSLGNLALGQLGIDRYKLKNCSNYWLTTIGDFDMHRSVGNRSGYDYDGFGYAVGGDARFCPDNFVLGLAFGNIYGKNNSREFSSRINQTSYIGLIYWGWLKEFNKKDALNLTGTASYGVTDNRMKTYYSDGMRSSGKWDNEAMRFTVKAEWLRDMGDDWTLAPFIGAEYDDVTADSFTERGDRPRFFAKGKMRNLAIPAGISLSRRQAFNDGKVWLNSVSAAYVPDVFRDNPEATVTRRTDDSISWTARGIETSRHAGRFEYSTRLIFNPTWSTFAGYTLEVRNNALYQKASLGVSASF